MKYNKLFQVVVATAVVATSVYRLVKVVKELVQERRSA